MEFISVPTLVPGVIAAGPNSQSSAGSVTDETTSVEIHRNVLFRRVVSLLALWEHYVCRKGVYVDA